MSLNSTVARFSRPTLRTLRQRVLLTSKKRTKKDKPTYELHNEGTIYQPPPANLFQIKDIEMLKVSFKEASTENDVIPNVEVANLPKQYFLPDINTEILQSQASSFKSLKSIKDYNVQSFVTKLHEVVTNTPWSKGIEKSYTDIFADELLRAGNLNVWPLRVMRGRLPYTLYIKGNAYVTSIPDITVDKQTDCRDVALVVVEDKHLENIGPITMHGETQLAIEILSCCSDTMRFIGNGNVDRTMYALRIISSYVTFYKAVIPATYWNELDVGLPKEESVIIERWPKKNGLRTGFNVAEANGREAVLTALAKISRKLLQ